MLKLSKRVAGVVSSSGAIFVCVSSLILTSELIDGVDQFSCHVKFQDNEQFLGQIVKARKSGPCQGY